MGRIESKFTGLVMAEMGSRVLEQVTAAHHEECRRMAQISAERLMLSGDITNGAYIYVKCYDKVFEAYYWPQISGPEESIYEQEITKGE